METAPVIDLSMIIVVYPTLIANIVRVQVYCLGPSLL